MSSESPATTPVAGQMATYTLRISADSGYESTTEGRCTAEQYSQAMGALHGAAAPVAPADYMYSTIADFEQSVGRPVNDVFRMGWNMARLKWSDVKGNPGVPINTEGSNPGVTPATLYLDTEFNGFGGDLISMALVASSGAHWYAALPCPNPTPWVRENVIPVLNATPVDWTSFVESLRSFLSQFTEGIQVIADWPEDIANFCRALQHAPGYRINTPPISFELYQKPSDLQSDIPHNALEDARALARALTQTQGTSS